MNSQPGSFIESYVPMPGSTLLVIATSGRVQGCTRKPGPAVPPHRATDGGQVRIFVALYFHF